MKRCIRDLHRKPGSGGGRRGTMFHYYMVYLFLSSVIMMTAGMCLHALLKADRLDTQTGVYLHAMQMLEQSLRDSPRDAQFVLDGQTLTISAGGQDTTWQIEENLVRRTDSRDGEIFRRERFLFARGTTVEFVQQGRLLRCRLIEPGVLPDTYQLADSQRASVEILIATRFAKEQG